jgi:hypothetical protein
MVDLHLIVILFILNLKLIYFLSRKRPGGNGLEHMTEVHKLINISSL